MIKLPLNPPSSALDGVVNEGFQEGHMNKNLGGSYMINTVLTDHCLDTLNVVGGRGFGYHPQHTGSQSSGQTPVQITHLQITSFSVSFSFSVAFSSLQFTNIQIGNTGPSPVTIAI